MRAVLQQMAPAYPRSTCSPMRRSAILRRPPTCWPPRPNGFQRAPSFSALSTPGVGGTRPLILEADGRWSAPATACSSWSGAVPERHAAGYEKLKFGWLLDARCPPTCGAPTYIAHDL